MTEKADSKKEPGSYIESLEVRQKNILWPDVLRGGRSVDELLWKGASDAPLVQRIGILILVSAYLIVALALISIAVEQGSWLTAFFAFVSCAVGGWFIRNAFRRWAKPSP
ncbi:MAG: hypothetical protein M3O31_14495 [Acidobacteriota bacterium]|nr:hypothetical protein [Acidobacteriota bacterium]